MGLDYNVKHKHWGLFSGLCTSVSVVQLTRLCTNTQNHLCADCETVAKLDLIIHAFAMEFHIIIWSNVSVLISYCAREGVM